MTRWACRRIRRRWLSSSFILTLPRHHGKGDVGDCTQPLSKQLILKPNLRFMSTKAQALSNPSSQSHAADERIVASMPPNTASTLTVKSPMESSTFSLTSCIESESGALTAPPVVDITSPLTLKSAPTLQPVFRRARFTTVSDPTLNRCLIEQAIQDNQQFTQPAILDNQREESREEKISKAKKQPIKRPAMILPSPRVVELYRVPSAHEVRVTTAFFKAFS